MYNCEVPRVRKFQSVSFIVLFMILMLGGCGYYFPNVYDGPSQKIYMPTWQNRTSNLGLDSDIYHSLSRWFQKSSSIVLTKKKSDADLILAGEIISIDRPSVSWDAGARTTEVKVKLVVRYILKDLKTDEILWEVPQELWTEGFSTQGGSAVMTDNEEKALDQILEDLSQRIYLGTLEKIRKKNVRSS